MPIHFTCPHCGITTDVSDEYAGQSGPCTRCGKTISIPRPDGLQPLSLADVSPKSGMRTRLHRRRRCGGAGVIGILVALLLPATEAAREAARRVSCTNNLKQIALAIHNYATANKCFPPAFIADKDGKPMHSWRVLLLPYLGEEELYRQYRFDEPWDSPHNQVLAAQMPRVYHCPSDPKTDSTETSYAMLVGPHAISDGPTGRGFGDIKDGFSYTIMVVEAAGVGINWLEPQDIDAETVRFYTVPALKPSEAPLIPKSPATTRAAPMWLSRTDRCDSYRKEWISGLSGR